MAEVNLLAEGRTLLPNKSAPLFISSDAEDPAAFYLNFASVVKKHLYTGGVLGHYFHFGKDVQVTSGVPHLAKFKEVGDAVIFAVKLAGSGLPYLYGVTVQELIKFNSSAPPATEVMDESKWLTAWKADHTELQALVVLKDTDTHALTAMADKFMSHMPMFKAVGIRSVKHAEVWAKKSYVSNIKAVLLQMEKAERKEGAARACRSKNASDSEASGGAAGTRWAAITEALLTVQEYYNDPLAERIICVDVDTETRQPTEAAIAAVKADLETDEYAQPLVAALDTAVADFAKGADAAAFYLSATTPLREILARSRKDKEEAPAPAAAAGRSARRVPAAVAADSDADADADKGEEAAADKGEEAAADEVEEVESPPAKRQRGRPAGSTNKPKGASPARSRAAC